MVVPFHRHHLRHFCERYRNIKNPDALPFPVGPVGFVVKPRIRFRENNTAPVMLPGKGTKRSSACQISGSIAQEKARLLRKTRVKEIFV